MKFKHPEITGFFFFFFSGNKYWVSCSKGMEEEKIFIECWLCTSHSAGSFHIPCFTYAPEQICRAGREVLWAHFTEGETGFERSQPELTHLGRKKARIQTQNHSRTTAQFLSTAPNCNSRPRHFLIMKLQLSLFNWEGTRYPRRFRDSPWHVLTGCTLRFTDNNFMFLCLGK